jgi:hypothetical protein
MPYNITTLFPLQSADTRNNIILYHGFTSLSPAQNIDLCGAELILGEDVVFLRMGHSYMKRTQTTPPTRTQANIMNKLCSRKLWIFCCSLLTSILAVVLDLSSVLM